MTNEFALISNAFCTVNASGSLVNYFICGFFASLVLILGVLCCLQGKGARPLQRYRPGGWGPVTYLAILPSRVLLASLEYGA